jgi:hypothetical protein
MSDFRLWWGSWGKMRFTCNPQFGYQSYTLVTRHTGEKMKRLTLVLLTAVALSAFAADTKVQGYLVDIACGSEERQRPNFGIKHSKGCLEMPDCAGSGYGVLTEDKKIIRFDAASNAKAKQFIAELKKNNDIKVNVTGTVNGDQMSVSKIELQ